MRKDKDIFYRILPVEGIFLGLNARAVEYLLLFGEWATTQDLELNIPEEHEFGILFVGNKEDGEDFVLAGSVWGDKVLPTVTYSHTTVEVDGEKRHLPLYKYKMANYDALVVGEVVEDAWSHEIEDNKHSFIYNNMNLLCLTNDFETRMYEWLDKEIELSEVLMEYDEGKF